MLETQDTAARCPEENAILDFIEGRMPPSAARSVEAHVDACDRCSALIADLAVWVSADNSTLPGAPSAPTFDGEASGGAGDFLPPGTALGRYVVEAMVGVGAMGAVYRASDPELDRDVAIKVLHQRTGPGLEQLGQEARALARLEHQNVVSVFDFGLHEQRPYIVEEFIAGQTLSAWLATGRSPAQILAVMAAAGAGLQAAHDAGIVHRDFKPSNVLIGPRGRVAVTDFGLATDTETLQPSAAQGSGEHPRKLVGTPAYMAPEHLASGAATPRSDQFSFCATTYEALVGSRPEPGTGAGALRGVLSDSAARALLRGLSPDPAARHASVRALVRRLTSRDRRRVAAGIGVAAAVVGGSLLALDPGPPRPPPRCDIDAGAHPWTAEQRARLREAFAASTEPYAAAAWTSVEARLDAHAVADAATAVAACERAAGRRTDAQWLARARSCLRHGQRHAQTLIRTLGRADRVTMRNAARAVHGLPRPQRCLHDPDPDSAPTDDARLDAARAMVLEAQVLDGLGDYQGALAVVRRAEQQAHALDDARLDAHIAFGLGRLIARTRSPHAAVEHFERAYSTAHAAGHDDVAGRVALSLVSVHSVDLGKLVPAQQWLRHARSAVDRSGHNRALLLSAAAGLDAADGRADLAAWGYLHAAAEYALRRGLGAHAFALALVNLAAQLQTLDHHDSAALVLRLALDRLTGQLGEAHPRLAKIHIILGLSLSGLERYAEAEAQCRAALQIQRRGYGARHLETAFPMQCLAETDVLRGQFAAAAARLERVAAIESAELEPDSMHHCLTLDLRAGVAIAQGRTEDALALLRRSLALRRATLGPDNPSSAYTKLQIGDAMLQAGRPREALAEYEEALEVVNRVFGPTDELTIWARAGLGETLLALGRDAEALARLERAHAELQARPGSARQRARVAFALARALEAGGEADNARIHALVDQARGELRGHEPSPLSSRIDAWLSRRSEASDER